jgi:hypothetical protein
MARAEGPTQIAACPPGTSQAGLSALDDLLGIIPRPLAWLLWDGPLARKKSFGFHHSDFLGYLVVSSFVITDRRFRCDTNSRKSYGVIPAVPE